MVLVEPDLVDADALGERDLVELAPEQLLMRRILARRRGRPDGEPHGITSPAPRGACRGGLRPCSSSRRMPSTGSGAGLFGRKTARGAPDVRLFPCPLGGTQRAPLSARCREVSRRWRR